MTRTNLSAFIRCLTRGMAAETLADESDRRLVERLLEGADQAAFEALVRRHGPMVYRVCWRILQHAQNAEDAFQATFLILAGKLATVRKRNSLASWLHGVARRVALKAQAQDGARRRRERRLAVPESVPPDNASWKEVRSVLDTELARMPEKWRLPLILCYLESRTQDEAAGQLGWSKNTLGRRLQEARAALRRRLTRRGLALSAAFCGPLLSDCTASAMVAPKLVASTVEAALRTAAGGAPGSLVSGKVIALTEGIARAMFVSKLKTIAAVFFFAGALTSATCMLAAERAAARVDQAKPEASESPAPQFEQTGKRAADAKAMNTISVRGQVLDADGKPVPAAHVFALAGPARATSAPEDYLPDLTDETKTDAEGRFELRARFAGGEAPPPPVHPLPAILVLADGRGMGLQAVTANASKEPIVIRLPPEQVLRARFVDDTTGKPVKDLIVKVALVANRSGILRAPPRAPKAWFPPMKTDAQGRLQLHGIGVVGAGQRLSVEWGDARFHGGPLSQSVSVQRRDARFQPQCIDLWRTEAHWSGQEVVYKLMPLLPEYVSGRVTFKDTAMPAAGVSVRTRGDTTKTDGEGRFRLKPDWRLSTFLTLGGAASEFATTVRAAVEVDASPGTAYLDGRGEAKPGRFPRRDGTLGPWQLGELRIALPRGIHVHGRVLEAGTHKGIAGARIAFGRYQASSGPDGTFSLTSAAGSGHLIVKAAAEYAPVEAKVAWGRLLAHAIVPLEVKEGTEAKPLEIVLRRGAVVKGKLAGPEGQPVRDAVLISRLLINQTPPSLSVSETFEIKGCDPEKAYPVIFFQEEKGWGALMHLSGKQSGKPLDVHLKPCGAARARFLTAEGRPITGRRTAGDLLVVLAAGATTGWGGFIEHSNIRKDWQTDAEGRITWRNLVPGVTYRVNNRDFTVRPGETLDLGDLKMGQGARPGRSAAATPTQRSEQRSTHPPAEGKPEGPERQMPVWKARAVLDATASSLRPEAPRCL